MEGYFFAEFLVFFEPFFLFELLAFILERLAGRECEGGIEEGGAVCIEHGVEVLN